MLAPYFSIRLKIDASAILAFNKYVSTGSIFLTFLVSPNIRHRRLAVLKTKDFFERDLPVRVVAQSAIKTPNL